MKERDSAIEVAVLLNMAAADRGCERGEMAQAKRSLLRVVKALRKHTDAVGARALAGFAEGSDDADLVSHGVGDLLDTLDRLEMLVRTGDDARTTTAVLAMKAVMLRARQRRVDIKARPYDFLYEDGEPVEPDVSKMLHALRMLALHIQATYPEMEAHDIATRVFADMLVPVLDAEERGDREYCDWVVRTIRRSIEPAVS